MVPFISFVLPSYHKEATGFLFLSSLFSNQGHTNKELSSLADSHITHWFELVYKTPLILYCEHLQHVTKEISSSYFMSLPKSRSRLIKKIMPWQYLHNSLTAPGENSEWGVIFFWSKLELTCLPSTGLIFTQKYLLLPFS